MRSVVLFAITPTVMLWHTSPLPYLSLPVCYLCRYVPDHYMALAFMVEYELGIPAARNTHFNSQAMMRSTTWQDGRMVTSFTVCAAIYIPCSGNKLLLRNTGARKADEDGVDIELQLLKDEAATILSAKPFLLLNEEEGKGLDVASKGRVNLRAGEKDSAGDKTAQLMEEEDSGSSMLGFDLRVFHPTHGTLPGLALLLVGAALWLVWSIV
jgi:hypothetical protein